MWLNPHSQWRERYADWPALKKLEYMDELMQELAGHPPRRVSRRKLAPLPSLKKTLRQHYDRKRAHYGYEYPNFYDRDLRRLFAEAADGAQGQPAGDALPRPASARTSAAASRAGPASTATPSTASSRT